MRKENFFFFKIIYLDAPSGDLICSEDSSIFHRMRCVCKITLRRHWTVKKIDAWSWHCKCISAGWDAAWFHWSWAKSIHTPIPLSLLETHFLHPTVNKTQICGGLWFIFKLFVHMSLYSWYLQKAHHISSWNRWSWDESYNQTSDISTSTCRTLNCEFYVCNNKGFVKSWFRNF